tara:strand:- start:2124 stop:2453 length:330 start_codon:yes stop_codon:yes gene_type:complete
MIINKIKDWLVKEIKENDKYTYDDYNGFDDLDVHLFRGRSECASGLLEQIKKWENNMEMIELLSLIYKLRDDIEKQKGIHYDHMRQLDKMIDIVKPLADHENKLQDPNL